jgi:hypothetical protein
MCPARPAPSVAPDRQKRSPSYSALDPFAQSFRDSILEARPEPFSATRIVPVFVFVGE